jgi:hypothetical protein
MRSHGTGAACYIERRGSACDDCRSVQRERNRRNRRARGIPEQGSAEHRAKVSASCRGYVKTPEHRAALAAALRREVVQNRAAHQRVVDERGPARDHTCVDCGEQAEQWSFNHRDTPPERVRQDPRNGNRGPGPYSLDTADYDARCISCHVKFDAKEVAH